MISQQLSLSKQLKKYHTCPACQKNLELNADNFFRDKSRPNGFKNKCKECDRKSSSVNRKVLNREGKEYFVGVFGNKCKCCGGSFDSACYDFHHRNPAEKKFKLSDSKYVLNEETLKEAAKCDLLCKNCHASLHAGYIQYDPFGDIYTRAARIS